MALARWDPFQEMISLRDAMNTLFEQSMVNPRAMTGSTMSMPMDVCSEGDNYIIEMPVPGASMDSIDISIEGRTVTVCGAFGGQQAQPDGQSQQQTGHDGQGQQGAQQRQYLSREMPRGRFERSVTLPTELNADKAQASCEKGVLRITVPKAEAAKRRRITVDGGQRQGQLQSQERSQQQGQSHQQGQSQPQAQSQPQGQGQRQQVHVGAGAERNT